MRRISTALAFFALLVVASPAAAAPQKLYYSGQTQAGEEFSMAITGKRLSELNGYVLATCVPTHGTPMTMAVPFNPPGSFVLGKTRKTTSVEELPFTGEVTKNYTVTMEKKRGHVWAADLSVDFSYEQVFVGDFGDFEQTFYICQADDEFLFKV
jgi:hypothetical protein